MTSFVRRATLLAVSSLLTAACTVSTESLDPNDSTLNGESVGSITSASSANLSAQQIERLHYLCNTQFDGTTPELISPGRDGAGALTAETATWRKVSCVTDSVDFTYVWERTLLGRAARVTINYNVAHTAVTVNSGECTTILAGRGAASARTTCDEAYERLRVWMEDDTHVKLFSLHTGCRDNGLSRSSDCTAAAHRFCNNNGYGAGVSQEVGANDLGIGCFQPSLYRDASSAELRGYHGGCGDPQSPDCMAAVHRLCNASGYTGGLIQELGPDARGVACFNGGYFGVDQSAVPGCAGDPTSGAACMSAAHNFCAARGFAGGLVQEVSRPALGIACFNGAYLLATIK